MGKSEKSLKAEYSIERSWTKAENLVTASTKRALAHAKMLG
jgi:hypothetical protein